MCELLDARSPIARTSAAVGGVYRARLVEFLEDYGKLVGADGAPLFLGRSLTYRWAAAAAPLVAALDGVSHWAPGATRHLASAMLRHFLGHGAIEADGTPSLGWFGRRAGQPRRPGFERSESRRGRIHRTMIGKDAAASWHVPTWVNGHTVTEAPGARIETVSILEGSWEFRIHRVENSESLSVVDSGWAVADDIPPRIENVGRQTRVIGRQGLVSTLLPVLGHAGEPFALDVTGGNTLGPFARVPTVIAQRQTDPVSILAVLVGLSGSAASRTLDHDPKVVAEPVTDAAHIVHIAMPSGAERRLLFSARGRSVRLDPAI